MAHENSKDILLIDDEPVVLHATTGVLMMLGHRVTTAATIQEAVVAFSSQKYDLVICDHNLDYEDPMEMCVYFKEASPSTHIYLSSGMPVDFDPSVFSGFLAKPCSVAQLDATIRQSAAPCSVLSST